MKYSRFKNVFSKKSKTVLTSSNTIDNSVVSHESDTFVTSSKEKTKRTIYDAFGIYGIVSISLGLPVIFAAFGFLVVLWHQSIRIFGLDQEIYFTPVDPVIVPQIPNFWHSLILQNWTTRAVTICSACIRVATAAQIGLMVSMVSSLICERFGCRAAQLAEFSVLRSVNAEPQSMLLPLIRNLRSVTHIICFLAILIFLSISLITQFLSTILFSDFEFCTIVGARNISSRPVMTLRNTIGPMSVWSSAPQSYPRFAEHTKAPPSSGDGFYDTGNVLRAFIPLSTSTERSTLRSYSGPALAYDARVSCLQPVLENINITNGLFDTIQDYTYAIFDVGVHNTSNVLSAGPETVTCNLFELPNSDDLIYAPPGNGLWELSLCYLAPMTVFRNPVVDIIGPSSTTFNSASNYLIINTTGTVDEVRKLSGAEIIQTEGPWVSLRKKDVNASIDISLCVTNFTPLTVNITAGANYDFPEPDLDWKSQSPDYGSYDGAHVALILGAFNNTDLLQGYERGLLDLGFPDNASNADESYIYLNAVEAPFGVTALFRGNETPISGPGFSSSVQMGGRLPLIPDGQTIIAHRKNIGLFQYIMTTTRNPALALQSLLTVLLGVVFYDFLPEFEVTADTTAVFSTQASIPIIWRGIYILGAALGIHLIFLFCIVTLFLRNTRVSFLGNFWMAVSQIVSQDTLAIIGSSTDKKDSKVDEWCIEKGLNNPIKVLPRFHLVDRSEAKFD
ncbi:hypothetical protein TWF694_011373 [Orbilia ellipsospora]|uniref:Uncharacterized protein n=1 Tax=Orbilia ellipsospora TaxID=2528407 RepID=A0AAV9X6A3_9PEZI